MKKVILFITFTLIIFSCTPEKVASDSQNQSNDILVSYYADIGTRQNEHFFEDNGSRYQKILSPDGKVFTSYIYDSENKMTSISYVPGYSNQSTYTFLYSDKGKVISMKKGGFYNSNSTNSEWNIIYENNIIKKVLKNTTSSSTRVTKYTLDSQGFVSIIHNYIEDTRTSTLVKTYDYTTVEYDSNKNIISIKFTNNGTHDLPDSPDPKNSESGIVKFEYDTNLNPIYPIFMNHYLNYILINEYPIYLGGNNQDHLLGIGYNNLKKTLRYGLGIYSGVSSIDNNYINIYEYDSNKKPIRLGRVSLVDNKEYSYIKYTYRTK
jgi:hypothetical protein